VALRYAGRSGLRVDRAGAHLGLATGERRTFVEGTALRGDVVAAGLLLVARVAASRYDDPNADDEPVDHADPLLTTGDGWLRVESLSACGGVAARLDLAPEGLDVAPRAPGTTHVDLGPRVRALLAGFVPRDPLRLDVGAAGLSAGVQDRRVPLTDRWLRSYVMLPALAAAMHPRARLTARHARAFLRGLPAASSSEAEPPHARAWDRGVFRPYEWPSARQAPGEQPPLDWLLPVRDWLRVVPTATEGAFPVGGAWRLRVLEPIARHATGLRVHTHEPTGTSWWQLDLPYGRLSVALSAEPGRAFADEAASLDPGPDGPPDERAHHGTASDERAHHGTASDERAHHGTAYDERARDATARDGSARAACAAGTRAYDVAEGRWYERVLPVDGAWLDDGSVTPARGGTAPR